MSSVSPFLPKIKAVPTKIISIWHGEAFQNERKEILVFLKVLINIIILIVPGDTILIIIIIILICHNSRWRSSSCDQANVLLISSWLLRWTR